MSTLMLKQPQTIFNRYTINYNTDLGCNEVGGTNICGYYEGPCGNNEECIGNLICGICNENFANGTNCCREPYSCSENHTSTKTCCSDLHQCDIDQGNCQDDSHCLGILQCGSSNCGDNFPNGTNCCKQPSTTEGGKFLNNTKRLFRALMGTLAMIKASNMHQYFFIYKCRAWTYLQWHQFL